MFTLLLISAAYDVARIVGLCNLFLALSVVTDRIVNSIARHYGLMTEATEYSIALIFNRMRCGTGN